MGLPALLDENLNSYIIKRNLLKHIIDVFVANGDRYNLLNSAVLELFEYMHKENLKPLLKYIVETFWSQLAKFENLTSMQSLKVGYEQSLESTGAKSVINVNPRKRAEECGLDKDEEDYFNEESDEEDTASASVSESRRRRAHSVSSNGSASHWQTLSSRPGGLLDYDDDEDDEDYKPPLSPRRKTDASDGDEGTLESLGVRRKMASREQPGLAKRQRLDRIPKSKDSVQFYQPRKLQVSHIVPPICQIQQSADTENHQEKEAEVVKRQCHDTRRTGEENGTEEKVASRNCSEASTKTRENGQLEREDHPHLHSQSSVEMVVPRPELPQQGRALFGFTRLMDVSLMAVDTVSRADQQLNLAGLAAGTYSGVTYGLREASGSHDWKSSAVAGAVTGMTLALTSDATTHKQTVQSVLSGAAVAANLLSGIPLE
ncbi:hypothetical protein Cgig2_029184 [Carnegiea gigantea]|uniref:Serine/threonine-protein phosphatase 4 regulatory subunit 3-like central domain-containing protein n=1 Tax=Carnegiea gigantea TaxID=171969 RepID=A0A9Q1QLZ4_9CARY|nr:hypothetical protein Cgig2_029184 [Carnegiea gigantea]